MFNHDQTGHTKESYLLGTSDSFLRDKRRHASPICCPLMLEDMLLATILLTWY